jgi:hypothetical protein
MGVSFLLASGITVRLRGKQSVTILQGLHWIRKKRVREGVRWRALVPVLQNDRSRSRRASGETAVLNPAVDSVVAD